MTKNEQFQKEIDEVIKDMNKKMIDAYRDSMVYGQGFLELPDGYQVDKGAVGNRIYSSILGKYIDASTGEVIND